MERMDRRTFLSVSAAAAAAAGVTAAGMGGLNGLGAQGDDGAPGLVAQLEALMARLPDAAFSVVDAASLGASPLVGEQISVAGRTFAVGDLLMALPADAFPLSAGNVLIAWLATAILKPLAGEGLATLVENRVLYYGAPGSVELTPGSEPR